MKYYVYVSDSKVDMLLPQVPHEVKKKVATEWKMDVKLLGASRKTETETEENRYVRLESVVSFIEEFGDVGSIDTPGEYVADTLPMRWGYLGARWGKKESPLVYFGGQTASTVVGLGGSTKHVIGNAGPASPYSQSLMPFLTSTLIDELGLDMETVHKQYAEIDSEHGYDVFTRSKNRKKLAADWAVFDAVFTATVGMTGPEQKLVFLAKRLLSGLPANIKYPPEVTSILLASPIYVALSE